MQLFSGFNFGNLLLWIFLALVVAGIVFLVLRRRKRKNFGYSSSKSAVFERPVQFSAKKDSLISNSRNPAQIETSMTGEKQSASVVCVKIKNSNEFGSDKSVNETLGKIVDLAEDSKAYTYDGQDGIFFIFIQSKTKTADNEKIAIDVADKALNKLKDHNKVFKTKINFGISASNGELVCRQNQNGLIFTSAGSMIPSAKILAGNADNEIALGEKLKDKLMSSIRTERKGSVYVLKEIKSSSSGSKTFAEGFVKRYKAEQEKQKQDSD
jgi:hypothetical protein